MSGVNFNDTTHQAGTGGGGAQGAALLDSSGTLSVDVNNRLLASVAGLPTVDWQNNLMIPTGLVFTYTPVGFNSISNGDILYDNVSGNYSYVFNNGPVNNSVLAYYPHNIYLITFTGGTGSISSGDQVTDSTTGALGLVYSVSGSTFIMMGMSGPFKAGDGFFTNDGFSGGTIVSAPLHTALLIANSSGTGTINPGDVWTDNTTGQTGTVVSNNTFLYVAFSGTLNIAVGDGFSTSSGFIGGVIEEISNSNVSATDTVTNGSGHTFTINSVYGTFGAGQGTIDWQNCILSDLNAGIQLSWSTAGVSVSNDLTANGNLYLPNIVGDFSLPAVQLGYEQSVSGTISQGLCLSVINDNTPTMGMQSSSAGTSYFQFAASQGSVASPTALLSGNGLGNIVWVGYGASGWTNYTVPAGIFVAATENWNDTATGTNIQFLTTANGSLTNNTWLMDQDGGLKGGVNSYITVASAILSNGYHLEPKEFDNGNITGTATIDLTAASSQKVTLTGNTTLTISNPVVGGTYVIRRVQNGTGGWIITWPATVIWPDNTIPAFSTNPNWVDIITLYWDGTNYYGAATIGYQP